MTDTRTLNRGLAQARTEAEGELAPLAAIYERALTGIATDASQTFASLTAATWQPQPEGSLLRGLALLAASIAEAQQKVQARILKIVAGETLQRLGIAWDVTHPLSQHLLAKAGMRTGDRLGAAVQPVLRETIAAAYEQGLSVPDTAALIRDKLLAATPWQAEMLARTDLNGLANGGSVIAARLAGVGFKTWLATMDDRTRDSHAEADGQTVPVDATFDVGGEQLEYPGDPAGSDAEVANCRCTVTYGDALDDTALVADGGSIMGAMTDTSRRAAVFAAKMPSGMKQMPSGVRGCSMNGTPGYSGGSACHIHDGSEPGMASAMRKAQRDAKGTASLLAASSPGAIPISGIAAIEGSVTRDNTPMPRVLLARSLGWDELPVPFMAKTVTAEGHDGAAIAGRIDSFRRKQGENGVWNIEFQGALTTPFGITEIAPMIADETLRGVSADLGSTQWAIVDSETLAEIPETELDVEAMAAGQYLVGLSEGQILAVTLCPTQAIAGATVALAASASHQAESLIATRVTIGDTIEALVAAATPVAPPREWFETQEPPGKMPLTITADGRVFGHIATWDTCHTGIAQVCTTPPRSGAGYAYFHAGELETAEGDKIPVGKLMLASKGGKHAPLSASRAEAAQHYDDTSMVAAYLRASDGRHGIWVAGALNPRLSADRLRELRTLPPSGDWREVNGRLELVCALAVPVPGFPVPRAEAALIASADELTLSALVASSGVYEPEPAVLRALAGAGLVADGEADDARMRALVARAEGGIDALVDLAST